LGKLPGTSKYKKLKTANITKSKQMLKWEETRKKGRPNYIWRTGVLTWGLIMCSIFVGMQSAQNPDRLLPILALNIPLWFCAGLIYGFLTWHALERQYNRYLANQPPGT
jgi:hypothetical protein